MTNSNRTSNNMTVKTADNMIDSDSYKAWDSVTADNMIYEKLQK